MRWKQDFKKLYDRMRMKVGNPSEATFDKKLQRKSNNLGLASSAAALVVFAAEEKSGYTAEFNKLDQVKQTRVAQIIQSLNTSTKISGTATTTKNKKKNIKSPVEVSSDFCDPYMGQSLYKGIPQEGYSIMYVLENSIRNFIIRVLSNLHGESWWSEVEKIKSLSNMAKEVKKRKTKEAKNWYHSKRGAHDIYYTDYPELLQIIRKFNSAFNGYFKKGAEKNLLEKLSELSPSRNVIAHNNPISSTDLARLKVHAKDWFNYMQHLYSTNK